MLVCLHDYTSPASAVTVLRLQSLADTGCAIAFEGFVPLEFGTALPVTLDVLSEREHFADRAADLGLDLKRPRRLPPTLRAHAVGMVAEVHELGASWRQACYRAFWEDGADLADPEVLGTVAQRAGLPRNDAEQATKDPAILRQLRQRMGRRRAQGAGGVPLLDAAGTLISPEVSDADLRLLAQL